MKTSGGVGISAWGSASGIVNCQGRGRNMIRLALAAVAQFYLLISELVVNVQEHQTRVLL